MNRATPLPPVWKGHEFSPSELEFWTQELAAAAFDLPAERRHAFVRAACSGSDDLESRVRSLLDSAMLPDAGVPSDHSFDAGTVIRDCLLLGRIGRGGMGEVYKAIQIPLHRLVAVKTLLGISDTHRAALAREAARLSLLDDAHIVAVYDADLSGDVPCIVMEYVDGITLRAWLDRHEAGGPRAPDAVVPILAQVTSALREAHRRGYVHGDVKPENILLTPDAGTYRVKLVDFGLACLMNQTTGGARGTPGYIAPDILGGGALDRRADVFSLGVVMVEMLTGTHPFAGGSAAETLANTLSGGPRLTPDLPEGYRPIVERALRADPAERYGSMDDLLADLQTVQAEAAADENPFLSEWPRPARQWLNRHRLGLPIAAVSLAWGCVSLAASVAAGAACLRVSWVPAGGHGSFEMLYGYAVEPNAAFWYVVGTPLLLLAGFGFLHAAHVGLARTPTLKAIGPPTDLTALQRLARANRRWFRVVTPAVAAIACAFVLVPELAWRDSNAFGWVQADQAGRHVGARYADLTTAGKIGTLEPVRALCTDCDIVVKTVHNRSGRYDPSSPAAFAIFLFLALAHQIAFTVFVVVMALKIVFFFAALSRALVGTDRRSVRLDPDLGDRHDYRFGLGRLDNAYYAILLFVSVASIGRLAQTAANVPKGTYFLAASSVAPLIGQPLVFLAILAVLALLLVAPMVGFLVLTLRSVDREAAALARHRAMLGRRLATARLALDREQLQREIQAIDERRAVAAKQSLLPTRRPVFWWLLALNVVLLFVAPTVLPALTRSQAWQSAGVFICAACGNTQPAQ